MLNPSIPQECLRNDVFCSHLWYADFPRELLGRLHQRQVLKHLISQPPNVVDGHLAVVEPDLSSGEARQVGGEVGTGPGAGLNGGGGGRIHSAAWEKEDLVLVKTAEFQSIALLSQNSRDIFFLS